MPNTPIDPGSMTFPALEFLDGSSAVLDSAPVLKIGARAFKRNRKAFQAYQSNNAGASGDGRIITEERTIDILVQKTSTKSVEQRLAEIEAALNTCVSLRIDSGTTIALSGSTGIHTSEPLGSDASGDLKATLGYIPTTPTSNDGTNDVLGPL